MMTRQGLRERISWLVPKRLSLSQAAFVLAGAGLYATSFIDPRLSHELAEFLRLAVAVAIFLLAWNVRRSLDDPYLFFISVAYVFVCAPEIVHALASQGMGFTGAGEPEVAAQSWLAARFLEAGALLVAPFLFGRKLRVGLVVAGSAAATALLLSTILAWRVFPSCVDAGGEPTPFLYAGEALVIVVFSAAFVLLRSRRARLDPQVARALATSIIFSVLAELFGGFWADPEGVRFLLRHLLKIGAFYFIYKAIVETGLARPLAVLFRNLKASEAALARLNAELEDRVGARTRELSDLNELLRVEIAERRQVEAGLRTSEEKYRVVAENTYDWEWWRDPDGRFLYVSPSCRKVTGRNAGEFLADPDLIFRIIHDDDRAAFLRHDKAVEATTAPGEMEFRIVHTDGSERWIAHACQPVLDEQGLLHGRRGSNRDVTARKRAEEALRDSEERLRALSARAMTAEEAARRRIAHELHDELGGSLAVLKIRTSLIEKALRKDQAGIREECRENLRQVDHIIGSVSRISRELSPSILEDIGLGAAVGWLADNFAKAHKVRVVVDVAAVDELVPKESRIMVYRIVQEALTNAGKHAQARTVTIEARREGAGLTFIVTDDGRGFSVADARGRAAHERGLGLGTMAERARMLGARLDIRSAPGKGTRLALTIPVEREAA
jgi:PAS domain S-box-containing protein